jgi:hypothetical protein
VSVPPPTVIIVPDDPSAWDIIGTAADIVAGLGTLGALIVAATVFRRQLIDQHRQQASETSLSQKKRLLEGADELTLVVSNYSKLPIYGTGRTVAFGSDGKVVRTAYAELDELSPGDSSMATLKINRSEDDFASCVYFRDSRGVEWLRFGTGQLVAARKGFDCNEPLAGTIMDRRRRLIEALNNLGRD